MRSLDRFALLFIHAACGLVLLAAACSNAPTSKLQGEWHEKNGNSVLKITAKKFSLDSSSDEAEDYFIKGDTIYTSFQGSQPYTKFVVNHVDDHKLNLLGPDSVQMEFNK